jgi:hypothetical protein
MARDKGSVRESFRQEPMKERKEWREVGGSVHHAIDKSQNSDCSWGGFLRQVKAAGNKVGGSARQEAREVSEKFQ